MVIKAGFRLSLRVPWTLGVRDRHSKAFFGKGLARPQHIIHRPDVWCRVRQREFFTFGMDVLLKLDLEQTRDFFASFFSLSDYHWQGFLSARLTFPQLIGFGVALFAHASNAARANLLVKGIPGLAVMLARLAQTLNYGPKSRADSRVDRVQT